MAEIKNITSNTLLSGTSGNDSIINGDWWYPNDVGHYGDNVTIDAGAGDDYIWNGVYSLTAINAGDGNDSIDNYGSSNVIIDAGAGDDSIYNVDSSNVTIKTGAGNDSVVNWSDSVTISGGKGNDFIYNNCYRQSDGSIYYHTDNDGSNVLFKYSSGDGNDKIYGFKADSTLSIAGTSYSTKKSNDDIIVTVGNGQITLVGADWLSAVNIVGDETPIETNSWTLSGTTAKYGSSDKTLVTVKGVKSLDGLDLNDKVVTVENSALNKKKITVSNGYTLELADDVTKPTTTKAAWSLKNSTATYKSSYKTEGYTLASNKKSITYSKATSASTLATIKGVKSTKGLSLKNNVITLKNSALNSKVTVSGDYEFDFASDYKKATITGSKNSDTITARGSNVVINGGAGADMIKMFGSGTLTGGNGADIFYFKSNKANVIKDYSEEDTISIASGTAEVETSITHFN